jgi:hypothetical protein
LLASVIDKKEARQLLGAAIRRLRMKSRHELELLLKEPETATMVGPSGTTYQTEAQAFWDDRKGRDLRVLVSIDDGGWRAIAPMSDSFIVAPDGSFVGE